jgi:hypothetical protein
LTLEPSTWFIGGWIRVEWQTHVDPDRQADRKMVLAWF